MKKSACAWATYIIHTFGPLVAAGGLARMIYAVAVLDLLTVLLSAGAFFCAFCSLIETPGERET